jgi:hypothetical protein
MNLSLHHVIVLCIVKCINMSLYYGMQLTHYSYSMGLWLTPQSHVFMQDGKKIWTTRIFMLIRII